MRHTKEQKYESSRRSLLELPKKHTHTILIPFRKNEEELYKKLEAFFADQYNHMKSAGTNEVSTLTLTLILNLNHNPNSIVVHYIHIESAGANDVHNITPIQILISNHVALGLSYRTYNGSFF
jgi:uncharacterized membrane-anchored protein